MNVSPRHLLSACLVMGIGCNFEDSATFDGADASARDMQTVEMGPISRDMDVIAPGLDMSPVDMRTLPPVDQGVRLDMPTVSPDQGLPPEDMRQDQESMTDMTSPADMGMSEPMCGNGVLEAGELCDGDCPASCNDGNVCTTDVRAGDDASCNVLCSYPAITACSTGDGCCPMGCDHAQDQDCTPPSTPDCANDASWPSAWVLGEANAQSYIGSTRTSGMCNGMSYPSRSAFSEDVPLVQAARCMAIWKKNNPGATGQQLVNRLAIEIGTAGYGGSEVQLIGGTSSSFNGAQNRLTSSAQSCQDIASPTFTKIGTGYVDDTVGTNDHTIMVILGN